MASVVHDIFSLPELSPKLLSPLLRFLRILLLPNQPLVINVLLKRFLGALWVDFFVPAKHIVVIHLLKSQVFEELVGLHRSPELLLLLFSFLKPLFDSIRKFLQLLFCFIFLFLLFFFLLFFLVLFHFLLFLFLFLFLFNLVDLYLNQPLFFLLFLLVLLGLYFLIFYLLISIRWFSKREKEPAISLLFWLCAVVFINNTLPMRLLDLDTLHLLLLDHLVLEVTLELFLTMLEVLVLVFLALDLKTTLFEQLLLLLLRA